MKIWNSDELIRAVKGGSPDVNLEQIAQKLGICQFDLFRQAYSAWCQDGPNDELVGHFFMNYVEHGDMPHWVSLYAEAMDAPADTRVSPAPMRAVA